MTQWIQYLNENKRSASVRAARIVHIRIYFYWLNEQGILDTAFNRLIRPTDIPKLPEYLPRPLPPDTDRELMARLENSNCMYQQGLLLMRRTGIRVGELISLEQNCIRVDPNGNAFLKVPLGKLDNERLVPLDDKALRILKKLQEQDPSDGKIYLLEQNTKKRKTHYGLYAKALKLAANELETDGKITTHRLRHTFATTLLNGGMSLVGLMKLMGHRSYRMTLRYAAVTGETINKEYFKALDKIQTKYDTPTQYDVPLSKTDPVQMLSDVIRCIQNRITSDTNKPQLARPLIKRIQRIQAALINLNI
jgi:site-specific recombinase XerD